MPTADELLGAAVLARLTECLRGADGRRRWAAVEAAELCRRHSFRPITTRRYYPGPHTIELQVNGVRYGLAEFELTAPHEEAHGAAWKRQTRAGRSE